MNGIERVRFDRFLRQMRAGGRTNMYGAVPYVMKTFGVDRTTAFSVVCEWLDRQQEADAGEDDPISAGRQKQRRTT